MLIFSEFDATGFSPANSSGGSIDYFGTIIRQRYPGSGLIHFFG
jgi:hypothetical protein